MVFGYHVQSPYVHETDDAMSSVARNPSVHCTEVAFQITSQVVSSLNLISLNQISLKFDL